jgi:hypothetical protein
VFADQLAQPAAWGLFLHGVGSDFCALHQCRYCSGLAGEMPGPLCPAAYGLWNRNIDRLAVAFQNER